MWIKPQAAQAIYLYLFLAPCWLFQNGGEMQKLFFIGSAVHGLTVDNYLKNNRYKPWTLSQ